VGEAGARGERAAGADRSSSRGERAAGADRSSSRGEPAADADRGSPRGERDAAGGRAPNDTEGGRGSRRKRGDNDSVVFETFRLEVGHTHGVKPGNIVGAIANEAGLEGRHIGQVDIRDDHSFVDLPEGMPKDIFRSLKKVRVVGQELRISRVDSKPPR
jgi:ATP-dependent RNA helicase DeaD